VADHTDSTVYDIIVVGGGPSGLTAALYAAREGMSVLVLEAKIIGGMAAVTEHIDNYPGFRDGIGGTALCDEMYEQALRFGAQIESGIQVETIVRQEEIFQVTTTNISYQATTIIIATGSDYKHMNIPGEAELIGRGIHFCATCDAPFYKDKRVIVVGGGNSAVQETLFVSKFAREVIMLVRGPSLKASQTIITELEQTANLTVKYMSPVSRVATEDGHLTGLMVRQPDGSEVLQEADGVFVFIGLVPNGTTTAEYELDAAGFIQTDDDFMTSVPGIFACGDIRSGSTWQIASAVGEGASVVLSIRKYREKRIL
jgi:thioredoxin reductase (NADPH)